MLVAGAPFYTKTLSAICAGELSVRTNSKQIEGKMKLNTFLIICSMLVSGCATGYQKHTWSGGYKDSMVGENEYFVEYYGNGTTSPQIVESFWNQRASEICPSGFDIIENREGENSGSFTNGATTFSHPWKKATIRCR